MNKYQKKYYQKNKIKVLQRNKKWRQKNRERMNKWFKEYWRKNPEKYEKHKELQRKCNKEHYQKNKEQIKEYNRKYRHDLIQKLKNEIFILLGNKCSKCGFSDKRALQIDHVHGGGKQEIKTITRIRYYIKIREKIQSGSKNYQLLCANCNWIKRYENKEVKF